MSRQLVAVVDVYEVTPTGGYQLFQGGIRVQPRTVTHCEEGDIIVDNHYFNLAISTFEGWREKDERNN